MTVVAILASVDVVPQRRLLEPDGLVPIFGEGNGAPRVHRRQFFLAHVMIEPAAVPSDAATQHQTHHPGAVYQVVMVPVVDTRTDDDHAFAFGDVGRVRPLAGKL
jgi:hypothetical protein